MSQLLKSATHGCRSEITVYCNPLILEKRFRVKAVPQFMEWRLVFELSFQALFPSPAESIINVSFFPFPFPSVDRLKENTRWVAKISNREAAPHIGHSRAIDSERKSLL